MAIRIGLGPYIPNHRLVADSDGDGVPDGWVDASSNLSFEHEYDARGFGRVRMTATNTISTSFIEYMSCRTEAIGTPANTKYGLSFVVESNQSNAGIYYDAISYSGATALFTTKTLTIGTADTPLRFIRAGTDNVGSDTDTYYIIRLGAYNLANGNWIEFSRFVTLQHTFDSDAYYKEMSVCPQVEGTDFGESGFAKWTRDATGRGSFEDGTPGLRKFRFAWPFTQIPQADDSWLNQFYFHTRSTPKADSNRFLVIYDTSLPDPGDDVPAHAQINPCYFAWVDDTYPFSRQANRWQPSNYKLQGVMNIEEP